MKLTRRRFVQWLAFFGALPLLRSRTVTGAEWPKEAFSAAGIETALHSLYGSAAPIPSNRISVRMASVVADGSRVPVVLSSTLEQVESMSIFIEKNPQPLAAHVDLREALPYFVVDLKFAGSSNVVFVVKAGDKLHALRRRIKIGVGAI